MYASAVQDMFEPLPYFPILYQTFCGSCFICCQICLRHRTCMCLIVPYTDELQGSFSYQYMYILLQIVTCLFFIVPYVNKSTNVNKKPACTKKERVIWLKQQFYSSFYRKECANYDLLKMYPLSLCGSHFLLTCSREILRKDP